MKIIALLEVSITAGGGFNQALNAILQMARLSEGNFDFAVMTSIHDNVAVLDRLGISARYFRPGLLDKIASGFHANEFARKIQKRLKWVSPLEKELMREGCDVVYFVSPSLLPASLQCLNYVVTVWDNCHRDFPEFPEVRNYGEFHHREFIYKNFLAAAYAVLVDSETLRDRIHMRYGIDKERLSVTPFAPNPMISEECSMRMEDVLARYDITPGYFFYPAQFWAHKNHARIIGALDILRRKGEIHRVVFVGGDQGNLPYLRGEIMRLGLSGQVSILGFVPSEHLRGLYQGSLAVIMPTYFGPTNIPPLEAWELGKPLIYSRHLADQCGNAALLVDPDNALSLAEAMESVLDSGIADTLCSLGKARLKEIDQMRRNAESILLDRLMAFKQRRINWGAYR